MKIPPPKVTFGGGAFIIEKNAANLCLHLARGAKIWYTDGKEKEGNVGDEKELCDGGLLCLV